MKRVSRLSVMCCALLLLAVAAVGASEEAPALSPAPPASETPKYVIEQVSVQAAPRAGALEGQMVLQVRQIGGDDTWVPILSGNVGVISAQVTGGGLFKGKPMLMRRDGTVGLLLPGKGDFAATITFATPIAREQQTSSAMLPMVPALTGSYEVTLEGGNLEVWLEPDVPHQVTSAAGRTVVTIYAAVQESLRVNWKPGPELREVDLIAFAEQNMLLAVSPGLMRVETTIQYSVLQGKMPEAGVELPAGYSLLKVEGKNLRTWDIAGEDPGPRTLSVSLLDPEVSGFELRLTLEKTLGPVPVEIEAPQITALGVMRQKGVIAVAVEKGLQAEILERENVGQVNLSEMPDAFGAQKDRISLCLRYLAQPFRVALRISTIEPKVHGEVSCLTVASLQRFRQYWHVQYEIRNAGLFQLRLRLDPEMKLTSLRGEDINNQSLDPATNVLTVDLRSKAEGKYALSLQTYSEIADPQRAVVPAIELVGAERQWGTMAMAVDAGVAVETGELSGISQIDVAELAGMAPVQEMVRTQETPAPILAFRYLTYPYALELAVSRILPELKVEPHHYVQITRKNLRYHSLFDYRIKKAGVFQLRLHLPAELRGSLVVRGDKVEDYSYDADTSVLTVQLTEKTTDQVQLEVETEALLGEELPKAGESGTLVIPALYTLDCEQERGYVAVGTDESIRLKRAGEGAGLHDVDVQEIAPALLQRARNAKLAFRVIESPWQLDVEVTSISPKVLVRTFNYVRLGEDYLMGASTVEFTVQYAGVKEFLVRLPAGVTKPNIRGENIKIQEKVEEPDADEEAGELWRVELQSEVKGQYQLIFEYSMDLTPEEQQRQFEGPVVIGVMDEVEREIGYVAVTGDPSLELAPLPDELKHLTPIDEEEIPVQFRQLPPSVAAQIGRETVPILFAFRYMAHPYLLALSSVRHDEADVVTAVIETCKLDTTLTREGNRITSLIASIRSRYQPFLEVRLPENAKLWHALVNGRRVRPLVEETSDGEVTKIPIAQVQGVQGPVKVEVQWEELGVEELGKLTSVGLTMPSFRGVRVLRLGWVLQLPRGYRVISSSGTLERLRNERYFESSIRDLQPTATPGEQQWETQVAGGQAARNPQWMSNAEVLTGRVSGKGVREAPVFAGTKPHLPEQFYFQGLILNPDVPAHVNARCAAGSAAQLLMGLIVLVVFGLCALIWHKSGLSPVASFVVLLAVVLGVAGLKIVAEDNYAPFLLAGLLTVAGAAVLLALGTISARIGRRIRGTTG